MNKINGFPITLKGLLSNSKYSIHYYQREYRWSRKEVEEMIDDLTSEFFSNYSKGDSRHDALGYGVYFMGSVVLTEDENAIIDGQQRLSTLTLLLIYLRNRLEELGINHSQIDQMIFSDECGEISFNINVEDRNQCMEALYKGRELDVSNVSDSVRNLYERYSDITELIEQSDLSNDNIANFSDWLINRLNFIQIIAATDQDAQKVFVTLNDRGLNLTSAEMLKGYLLSEIEDDEKRRRYNDLWKDCMQDLRNLEKHGDENFLRIWLRSQYAESIRNNKAENLDFDLIGGSFHEWVRNEKDKLGLFTSRDYEHFLDQMLWFAQIYQKIIKAEREYSEELPYVFYNAQIDFTLQPQLLMASVVYGDKPEIVTEKLNLMARYIDLHVFAKVTSYHSVRYSGIKKTMFTLNKAVRGADIDSLKRILAQNYSDLRYSAEEILPLFGLNSYTKKYIKHFLARMLNHLEAEMGFSPKYQEYIRKTSNPYEIEHILCDHYERFEDIFEDNEDFRKWRNNFGALLLLPKSTNASLKDNNYEEKLETYCLAEKGNILSASLGPGFYNHNPGYNRLIAENNLSFEPYESFSKDEITKRNRLYCEICNLVWNPDMFRIDGKDPVDYSYVSSRQKKKAFSFDFCGIKPGEIIQFIKDPEIKAVVYDSKTVIYEDKQWSLSRLASKLLGREYNGVQGPLYFTYKGTVLNDLRND